ncbi:hypothetical protein [Blastococcus jejuensis]|uniref:hypothetical protein n=1 Tax=Blastococcus jejuensis TaxID=351224 RepID=UPI0031DD1898
MRIALRARRTRRQRVLLAAANPLMADYVLRMWHTIADLDGVEARLTRHTGLAQRQERVKAIARWRARLYPWDLILLADHMPLEYARTIPKVIMPHGPGPSRIVRGGSYYYDRQRVFWPDGERVYTLMFDTSEVAKTRALAGVPEYRDKIVVVGDLRADELLKASARAEETRSGMGIGDRKLVGIMSTWGPYGLVPTLGEALVGELKRIASVGEYAFALTMHQNLWDVSRCGTTRWRDMLLGAESEFIRVIRPHEDTAMVLGACHMVVSDHTSLAMTFSILRRPIIPVAVPVGVVGEGTFSHWLLTNRRPLSRADELYEALRTAHSNYALDGAPTVIDRLGESAGLVREALANALNNGDRQR